MPLTFYYETILGKKNKKEKINIAVNSITNEEGSKSQWCLATNIKDREQVIND
ncbi:MAG: hypothetical protein AB1478_11355 [Nitrospirota bacterium]